MGYYIETVGQTHGKAARIARENNGKLLDGPPAHFHEIPEGKALICVVDNGSFEAAGFCYSERELEEFRAADYTGPARQIPGVYVVDLDAGRTSQRTRTWVLIDWHKACELTGYHP